MYISSHPKHKITDNENKNDYKFYKNNNILILCFKYYYQVLKVM